MDQSEFSAPTRNWLAQGRHVQVAGHNIFVYEKGQGPAVLLLHGFPTSCYDFRGIIDRLADAYRCITFDFPGYGLSDKPIDYSYSLFQQTDVAQAIAADCGITEAHIVGHDVGQTIHAELLFREQEGRLPFRILTSTVLNGSTLRAKESLTSFQKLLTSNEKLPQAMATLDRLTETYIPALQALMKRPQAITEEDSQVMRELLLYQDGNHRIPSISGYMRERVIHQDRWIGALRDAKSPMQIIWADGDPVANIEKGHELRKILKQAKYIELKDLGHFLIMEDPPTIARHIRAFLDSR
ncbi:MAG: alpha/beta fold hydrolase [Acidimicrobiia bacterium]